MVRLEEKDAASVSAEDDDTHCKNAEETKTRDQKSEDGGRTRTCESRWRRQSLILPSQSANTSVSSEQVKLQCRWKTAAQLDEWVSESDMISKTNWNFALYLIEFSVYIFQNVSNNVQNGEMSPVNVTSRRESGSVRTWLNITWMKLEHLSPVR